MTGQPTVPAHVLPHRTPTQLLAMARQGLTEAAQTRAVGLRYANAHLAALRAATAVMATRTPPATAGRRGRLTSVWGLLAEVAPEMSRWAEHFAAGSSKRAAAEAGIPRAVTPEEADDLLRSAEQFVTVVATAIGEAHDFDPSDCAFCVAPTTRRLPNGAAASCPLHGGPMPPTGEDEIRRDERERIRRSLTQPMLQALRLIPSGRVQQGCVVSDGDVVRQRLRAAYLAITADPAAGDQPAPAAVPLDLVEVAPWLEQCGRCDAGLPQECTCPRGDVRVVIGALVDEVTLLRRELHGDGQLSEEEAYRLADHYAGIGSVLRKARKARQAEALWSDQPKETA